MTLNKFAKGSLAAAAMVVMAALAPAQAAPTILVNLSTSNIQLGDVLGVDINVSGLTGALGAFAFDLNFDGARLSYSFSAADPDGKMGTAAIPGDDLSGGPSGSSVNFLVLAGFDLTTFTAVPEATLAAQQGAGFTMGRVELNATNLGFASMSISNFSLSDYNGVDITGVTARGAQVCVSADGQTPCGGQVVPEPMSALLVGVALGGLALTRRRVKSA